MKNHTLKEFHIRQKKGIRLLLFPIPFQGHINPMLQLANILYSKGFSIIIIHTSFNSLNPSNYPEFAFHSIHHGLSEEEVNEASSRVVDVAALLNSINITCVESFQEALGKLLSENLEEEEPVACLITDALWHFTQAVTDSLHLPRIMLRTSNACSLLVLEHLQLFCRKGYIPLQAARVEERIPEFPHLKFKDLPQVKTQNQEDMVHLLVASMIRTIKGSSGLIWNTCQDLERSDLVKSSQLLNIPIFPLGPLYKHFPCISKSSLLGQDQTSISWLNTQAPKSVLYVSFGSIATVTKAEFLEIAWGLANSQQPFLWVVRPKSVENSEWIEFLPDGFDGGKLGYIVKWAPQEEVLAHPATGGFWTHCGWNSILESICQGVPMICAPSFGDQLANARYVSDVWRIGIHLEGEVKRGKIERAVKELMAEEEGARMRERVGYMKAKMECCIEPGGSSYKALNSLVDHILSL